MTIEVLETPERLAERGADVLAEVLRTAIATRYAGLLVALAGSPPILDVVQLGMGDDGHTDHPTLEKERS